MPRYTKRFQVGPYWLSQRKGSPAFYRTWYAGGRTHRTSLETDDRAEAEKRLTAFFVAEQSAKPQNSGALLGAVLDQYWEEHGKNAVSASTIRLQVADWKSHFGDQTVDEAMGYDAQAAFKTALISRGLSASSVNKIMATGKAALRLAWKKRVIASVPPVTMLPVGDQEPMGYPIGPEDAAKLLYQCDGHLRLFVLLLMGTLARPGAVRDLEKAQVDFEFGLIDLNPAGRKQNKKRRPVVRLPGFLRAELEDAPDGALVQWRGEKVKSLRTAFRKARKRAKLRAEVNTYSFRHGLAKWMRARGVPKWEVEGQLGHRKGTTDIYAHVAPDYLQNALDAIEAYYAVVNAYLQKLEQDARKESEACGEVLVESETRAA